MDKSKQIEQHLLSGMNLTHLMAIDLFAHSRLSSVVNRMRNRGIPVKTVMIPTADGKSKYAKYFIPINERMNEKNRKRMGGDD